MLKQLAELGRVRTVTGPLMLEALHEELHELRRYRGLEYGCDVPVDCLTSFESRVLLQSAMFDWYCKKYGMSATAPILYSGQYERYSIPSSSTIFAVFSVPNEYQPILWFIDIANTTEWWDILEPKRHLAIVGFTSCGFKD